MLPAVQAAREAARRMHCSSNLKQIGVALHNYQAAVRTLPFGSGYPASGAASFTPTATEPRPVSGTWPTMLLPYLEETVLYDQIDFTKYMQNQSATALTTVISVYLCVSDASAENAILSDRYAVDNPGRAMGLWYTGSMGPTMPDFCIFCSSQQPSPANYCCQGNDFGTSAPVGNGVGMFMRYHKSISLNDVTDGLSKTIMVGETLPRDCIFISAFGPNFNVSSTCIPINTMETDQGQVTNWWRTSGFKSRHPGGANFCLADGSVRFIDEDIDFQLYNALGTRAGAEIVRLEF